jgi:hypothetical protein
MAEPTTDEKGIALEQATIKQLAEAHRALLLLKLDEVNAARKEFKTIPIDLYDAERIPVKRQEKTFLLTSGSYSHHGFCRPLIEETLEHIIDIPEDKFKYLNLCKAEFQEKMVYSPEGGIAFGDILMTAIYYYTPMMNYLHDNNFKAYVALEQSAQSAANFLRWLNGQIDKYKRWMEFNSEPVNEVATPLKDEGKAAEKNTGTSKPPDPKKTRQAKPLNPEDHMRTWIYLNESTDPDLAFCAEIEEICLALEGSGIEDYRAPFIDKKGLTKTDCHLRRINFINHFKKDAFRDVIVKVVTANKANNHGYAVIRTSGYQAFQGRVDSIITLIRKLREAR